MSASRVPSLTESSIPSSQARRSNTPRISGSMDEPHGATKPHEHTIQSTGTAMSTASSRRSDLTFTGPPYVPKAKPYQRSDYSHSPAELMKIGYENEVLVKKLTGISAQPPARWVEDLKRKEEAGPQAGHATVNRRRAEEATARQNQALYQRLVAIKPSKDISATVLAQQYQQALKYRMNCSSFKPNPELAKPAAPGDH